MTTDTDWWRGAVIYQVYPRSFQDSNDDGVGDLNGITRRLPHIASLGVDAVWISPFFKSPMADMGYDVSDYRDVDPLFGTLADFDRLIAAAHALGLRIIVDQVLSHTSDQHAWFVDSRTSKAAAKSDWYVWADAKPDGTAPNNWLSVFGGPAWEWDGVRMQYYMHSFLTSQPDLNLHNPAVQDELLDTIRFWLDRGVDGFRLDACNHYFHDLKLRDNPPAAAHGDKGSVQATNPYGFQDHLYDKSQPENLAFLQRLRGLLADYPGAIALGEVGDEERSPATVQAYTSGDGHLHCSYTFDLFGTAFDPAHFRKIFEAFGRASDGGAVCWSISNHDVMRYVSRWTKPGDDPAAIARLAINLLVSLRGPVCLYQGEELGLPEADLAFEDLRDPYGIRFWPAFKGRDGCRTPMPWEGDAPHAGFSAAKPWLPVPAEHLPLAQDRQDSDPASVLALYREAIGQRKRHPALVEGTLTFLDSGDEDILVFVRATPHERLLCLFNFARQERTWEGEDDVIDLPPLGFARVPTEL
ncbi:MAG TPA: alpha-glucosidase family protein [Sphingobium sp.]